LKEDLDLEILSDDDTKTGKNKEKRESTYKDYQVIPNKVIEPDDVKITVIETVKAVVPVGVQQIGLNDEYYDEKIESKFFY
jgi:hypothetical protein